MILTSNNNMASKKLMKSKTIYRVWVEVERINEEKNIYETVDLNLPSEADFKSQRAAAQFAARLHDVSQMIQQTTRDHSAGKAKFDPARGFDSPQSAREYACRYPNPGTRLAEIVTHNMDTGELGFAAECVLEAEFIGPVKNTRHERDV